MYAQDNILCQFGLINLSSVQQLISQPILIHFWWELYQLENLEDKVSPEENENYRSGVGTLLCLTKHSRPDSCNPVRELSKTIDAPAPVRLKEMYKVIRHVLSTRGHGQKFELTKNIKKWALKALSDSDFASDKEARISVFGSIIYFC